MADYRRILISHPRRAGKTCMDFPFDPWTYGAKNIPTTEEEPVPQSKPDRRWRKGDMIKNPETGERLKIIHASKDGKFLTVSLPGGRVQGFTHPTGVRDARNRR